MDENEERLEAAKAKLLAKGKDTKKLLKKMKQEFQFGDTDDDKDPYALSVRDINSPSVHILTPMLGG